MINQALWREQLIEEVKKEIMTQAREKAKEIRESPRLETSIDSQEKLRNIKKLQDLQRNYDYLQRELIQHTNSIRAQTKVPLRPMKSLLDSTPSMSISDRSSVLQSHVSHMQYLQNRAKLILQKEKIARLATILERPILTEKLLKEKRKEKVDLKFPVFVPLSTIRKEKHLPPRVVNQKLSSGEVMPVYMVGTPTPRYDPMVRIEQSIPIQNRCNEYRDSVDATAHTNHNISMDSVFYYKIFKNPKGKKSITSSTPDPVKTLTEAQLGKSPRPLTPTGMPNVWMFRELEYDKKNIKPKRKWVADRMQKYSEVRVKKDFLPKIDPNKSLELRLNQEKQNHQIKSFDRVKFL